PGAEQSPDRSADEQRAAEDLGAAYKHAAYAVQMGTRPQTMYGLNDSPIFLAAYMLDHDPTSYATLIRPAFVDGVEGGLTRDDILDNITMFWLTNTGVSTAKSYWEYLGYGSFANARNVTVPVAVSVFPDELFKAPRSWTEQAYPNLVHYNELDRGGHFAAWEQPELYASELRADASVRVVGGRAAVRGPRNHRVHAFTECELTQLGVARHRRPLDIGAEVQAGNHVGDPHFRRCLAVVEVDRLPERGREERR